MRATPRCWTTAALAAFGLLAAPARAQKPDLWYTIFPPIEGIHQAGSPDFERDFFDESKWPTALANVSAVKIYTQFAVWGNKDLQRRVYAFLAQHHIALAIEGLVLKESPQCGHNVEGYDGDFPGLAASIRDLGGPLTYVAPDEPLFFGHQYTGQNACRSSLPDLAQQIATVLHGVRAVFPNVVWGDIEPATTNEIGPWLTQYRKATGETLGFFHIDVDWDNAASPDALDSMLGTLSKAKVPIGLICNGAASAKTAQAWIDQAIVHCEQYKDKPVPVSTIVVQSWNHQPSTAFDETRADTLAGLAARMVSRNWIRPRGQ